MRATRRRGRTGSCNLRSTDIPVCDLRRSSWPIGPCLITKCRKCESPKKTGRKCLTGRPIKCLTGRPIKCLTGRPIKCLTGRPIGRSAFRANALSVANSSVGNALCGVPRPGTPISRLAKLRNANLPIGCLTLRTPRRAVATDHFPQDCHCFLNLIAYRSTI